MSPSVYSAACELPRRKSSTATATAPGVLLYLCPLAQLRCRDIYCATNTRGPTNALRCRWGARTRKKREMRRAWRVGWSVPGSSSPISNPSPIPIPDFASMTDASPKTCTDCTGEQCSLRRRRSKSFGLCHLPMRGASVHQSRGSVAYTPSFPSQRHKWDKGLSDKG